MTSVPVNDENYGVSPGQKHNTSDTICDIFAITQPTGRSSILRQSQADNLPNKAAPKGIKVCFQTPRRDPVTKRIISPTKVETMTSLDECTKTLDSVTVSSVETSQKCNGSLPVDMPSKTDAPYPDDDMPIQSKGGYDIDFDNLEAMNPFQASNNMMLSPPRTCEPMGVQISAEPEQAEGISSNSAGIPLGENISAVPTKTDDVLDETLPFSPSVENSIADMSADMRSTDSSVIVVKTPGTPQMEQSILSPGEPEVTRASPVLKERSVSEDKTEVQASPLPPKGSYTFDFDSLDSVNPFQTGGSKIQNSPCPGQRPPPCARSPGLKMEASLGEASESKAEESESATQAEATQKESPLPAAAPPPSTSPPAKDGAAVVLEFNFDDGAAVKRKPPPKRLGQRPPGAKPGVKKTSGAPAEKKPPMPSTQAPPKPGDDPTPDIPLPKGAYNFDFDKFDDPNFNPFGTKVKMGNSPPRGLQNSPVMKGAAEALVQESASHTEQAEQPTQGATEGSHSLASTGDGAPEATGPLAKQTGEEPSSVSQNGAAKSHPAPEEPGRLTPEPCDTVQQNRTPEPAAPAPNDEFVPGTIILAGNFDGEIDYLEQFGSSSFKDSALRKQSLYLKFDPLLRESPKKTGAATGCVGLPQPSLTTRMDSKTEVKLQPGVPSEGMKLLDDFPAPVVTPLAQDPTVLDLLVPDLRQPAPAPPKDAIIEVLKYTQKDMDAAMERAQSRAQEEEAKWRAECEKLRQDEQNMGHIISEFEATIEQMKEDHMRDKQATVAELKRVLQEKEQVSSDLNTMERSFYELFKRLDKHKEVIEGYKKNEDTLKACAQDYMTRIKKEEQRYQSLKAHAEEKIKQANSEIADVRSKMKTEVIGLQAQLKREQLRVHSLEKTLEQKVKEFEEVTKLCDELIANAQKH